MTPDGPVQIPPSPLLLIAGNARDFGAFSDFCFAYFTGYHGNHRYCDFKSNKHKILCFRRRGNEFSGSLKKDQCNQRYSIMNRFFPIPD